MEGDMTTTPSLFDSDPRFAPVAPAPTIEERFQAFHQANPWVYDALCRLARQRVRHGIRRIGIGMLFEVLRWEWQGATSDPNAEWRINNSYRSRYARLIMATEQDLAGVFETRELKAA
jgi:hypothetical protein